MKKNKTLHSKVLNKRTNLKLVSFIGTLMMFCSTTMVAFAATDPVDQINNFESHLAALIGAAGGIALLIGVVIVAQGIAGHDPSQKMTGGVIAAAGVLLASASYVVNNWFTAASIHMLPALSDFDVTSIFNSINLI